MMSLSATELFYELVGDDGDYEDLEELDVADFSNFAVSLADFEEEEPAPPRRFRGGRGAPTPVPTPVNGGGWRGNKGAPFVPKVAGKFMFSTCNDFECSVCMEPFTEKSTTGTPFSTSPAAAAC